MYILYCLIGIFVIVFTVVMAICLHKKRQNKRHEFKSQIAERQAVQQKIVQTPTQTSQIMRVPQIIYDHEQFAIENGVLIKYLGKELEVQIPNGVKEIGEEAFCKNQRIRSVFIPSSVEKVHFCAFAYCVMLSEIHFAEGLSSIEWSAFCGCTSLQRLDLPQTVSDIGKRAFSECKNLQYVSIKNSCPKIEHQAFYNAKINELHLGQDLSKIKMCDFPGSKFYRERLHIYVPSLSAWLTHTAALLFDHSLSGSHGGGCCYDLFVGDRLLENLTVTTNIPPTCFACCSSIKNITLGDGVEEIGKEAFYGCDITDLYIPQNVVAIGDNAFGYCRELKHVTLPSAYRARIYTIFSDCPNAQFEFI